MEDKELCKLTLRAGIWTNKGKQCAPVTICERPDYFALGCSMFPRAERREIGAQRQKGISG